MRVICLILQRCKARLPGKRPSRPSHHSFLPASCLAPPILTSRTNSGLRSPTAEAKMSASCHGLPSNKLALTLDAPTEARQIAISPDHAVTRNCECDRIRCACVCNNASGQGTNPAAEFQIAHRLSDGDRAHLLPHATLNRRPAHIKRELEPHGRIFDKPDDLR